MSASELNLRGGAYVGNFKNELMFANQPNYKSLAHFVPLRVWTPAVPNSDRHEMLPKGPEDDERSYNGTKCTM